MARQATSLKLPAPLKARVAAAANAVGKTPHAFMVEAIEAETTRAELFDRFFEEALASEREAERSAQHYPAADVLAYMTARAEGKPARRPRPKRWRK